MIWVAVSGWLVAVGILGWALRRHRPVPTPDVFTQPIETDLTPTHKFMVVCRTNSGGRARRMYEVGTVGAGEVLEFWDETARRDLKAGPPA